MTGPDVGHAAGLEPISVVESFFRVEGAVARGYESVAKLFVSNFRKGQEANAQCCAYVGGRRVVDLWGTSTEARDQKYDGDSLQVVFSCTKNLSSIAVATLVDRGLLNYSDKVCRHWPEFGACGKEDITVADVLRHESGLATFEGRFPAVTSMWTENIKKNEVGAIIEKEGCRWPVNDFGSKREYHSVTRGFILNEIFRRVDPDKRTLGEFVREEFATGLDIDVYIGTYNERDVIARNARLSLWGGLYSLGATEAPILGPLC
jgi:CubicO group peptidase (beta-lactamase class C family)